MQTYTCLKMVTRSGSLIFQPCTVALNEAVRLQDGQINRVNVAFNGSNRLTRYASNRFAPARCEKSPRAFYACRSRLQVLSPSRKKNDMAKIKLGARPKNFTATVKTKLLNGDEVSVEMKYTYRTRSEFGAFWTRFSLKTKSNRRTTASRPLPPRCSRHTRPALNVTPTRSCALRQKAGTWMRISAAKTSSLCVTKSRHGLRHHGHLSRSYH